MFNFPPTRPGAEPRVKPVVHRVLSGEFKHHYLLQSGVLAYQKAPLTKTCGKQRLGYQLLVDDTGESAFLDLYQANEPGRTRLGQLAFLALAWGAPAQLAKPARSTGLPQVLTVLAKDYPGRDLESLAKIGRTLGFQVQRPASGFDAGVHHIRQLQSCLDQACGLHADSGIDWRAGVNLNVLAQVLANELVRLGQWTSSRMFAGLAGPVTYVRREAPQAWLDDVSHLVGRTWSELKQQAPAYFVWQALQEPGRGTAAHLEASATPPRSTSVH